MDKTTRTTIRTLPLALAGLLIAMSAQLAGAQALREANDALSARAFDRAELRVDADTALLSEAASFVASDTDMAWQAFAAGQSAPWIAYVDKRTGKIDYAEGGNVAWIPGAGNRLASSGKVTLASLETLARQQLANVAGMLGVNPADLVLNAGRSGQPAVHVWFVDFDVLAGGRKVEGARVVFYVNNGNLIAFGSENLPAPGTRVPAVRVPVEAARATFFAHVDGFQAGDSIVDNGSYKLLPTAVASKSFAEGYAPGNGRGLVGVWEFSFRREGILGTWRGRVDATSGKLLEFYDMNEYGSATGGAYRSDRPATEVVLPLPWANVASGVYTNSAGVFSGTTGTTTLQGQYVKMTDSCGSISKAADGSGVIALGSGTGTDCTIPSTGGGAGNTHATRTQFYMINRAKEIGRGWLPSNTWLNGSITVNVNLNQTCNAYWNGSTVNFFRSGGGCANTGELPGVSLHEWGHGLDSNDGNGSSADNGTGETYGDFSAALFTHNSCIGNGFLGTSNCGGYGNACNSCSGVRDIDYAKHARNTPSTVANFTQTTCPNPSPNNPNYKGPCGKEGHCESLVTSEALWDFANRDLPSPGSGSAWATADRLWYLSRSTATKGFACTASGTWTSNGCVTGSYFRAMRAVDDDNGNLTDGTPHGGALGTAFNRHGIACTTDTGWNVTFAGVTPPAVPALTVTAGSNSAALSWSGSTGVYDIYRNEAGCNAGFTKAANDISGASYNDTAVANGVTYYYQVVAQPAGNEAAASAPSTCQTVTPVSGPCTPPAAPTGVTASSSAQTTSSVSWTAASGATSYSISRATVSGGPYSAVGSSASTSFADSGLTCNTTYYYVVSASNGSCSSGNSTQASVTTAACGGGGSTLTNGVPVTGISGAAASQQTWTMAVPAGASALKFQTAGGTGDADMYVRFGAAPTLTTYDCRPYATGNAETCNIATAQVGTYYVMLNGYSAYSGLTLTGSYTTGGGGCSVVAESEANNGTTTADPLVAPCSTVNGTFVGGTDTNDYFSMTVPAGATVTGLLNNLSVDYDLYLYRAGSTTAVAQSTAGGTAAETATWTNTTGASTTVYARVYKYSATRATYTVKVSY